MTSHATSSPQSEPIRGFSRTGRIASILAITLAIASLARADTPAITSAIANTATNILTITGTSLLGPDSDGVNSVTLAGIALTVVTQTATSITASFPATSPASSLAPGTYPLVVTFFGSSRPNNASFNVTVGPQTRLLFPYVSAGPTRTTTIVISNVSLDPATGSPAVSGACTLYLIGFVSFRKHLYCRSQAGGFLLS